MKNILLLITCTFMLAACNQDPNIDTPSTVNPGSVEGSTDNRGSDEPSTGGVTPESDISLDTPTQEADSQDTPEDTSPGGVTEEETAEDTTPDDVTETETETPEETIPDTVTENDEGCQFGSIEYFDTVEDGLPILDDFCGSWEAYSEGVRHVHTGMGWDVKALYGVIAATSAYYGKDVDISTAIQVHAEAESYWHNDWGLTNRIREGSATDEEKFITATLLLFDYALEANGYNTDVNRHFSLWEFVKYGDDSSLSGSLLILYQFIRGGNIFEMGSRIGRDPTLATTIEPFNRVF